MFTREAVAAVFQASGGLPRTVNVISDNALIGGFASQVKPINAKFVEEVCRDFDITGSAAPVSSLSEEEARAESTGADAGKRARAGAGTPASGQSSTRAAADERGGARRRGAGPADVRHRESQAVLVLLMAKGFEGRNGMRNQRTLARLGHARGVWVAVSTVASLLSLGIGLAGAQTPPAAGASVARPAVPSERYVRGPNRHPTVP